MSTATALSEASGSPVDTAGLSHLAAWQDIVTSNPNGTALISYHQKPSSFRWVGGRHVDSDYLEWTFTDLDRGARRLANTLNRLTPVNRRPIAVFLNNQAEWALFFWAAAYLHSPLAPINPKSAARSDEVAHMIRLIQPAVIVSLDAVVASQLEASLGAKALDDIPVRITLAPPSSDHGLSLDWRSLSSIMSDELSPPDTPLIADPLDTAVILFTSGTTSLPKPCGLSSAMTANAALAYVEPRNLAPGHRFILHLPNFHSYGIGWALAFLLVGATIIYPSESFEAQASLHCIEKFGATHMSLVPTTAQAITVHPAFANTDISTLVSIDISGAGVLPSVVDSCERLLHVPAGTSYGMTESPSTLIWPIADGSVVRHGDVLSGRPSRGARVKICEPGTRNLLPRGEPGELHNGGLQVIPSYMDPGVKSDAFYVDDQGCQWIMTGDQAVMESDGAVRISGRYKDLIIRGGENISPASIEACLQKAPGVYMAQVIGVPDEMAGEVPIAVIQTTGDNITPANELKTMASDSLGPAFAPKMVLNMVDDLGLDAFPTTAAGKVRKVELAAIVKQYLKDRQGPAVDRAAPTVDSLINIWERISGAENLRPSSSIQSFADSLMMMQLSGLVKRELNRDITVEDFKSCDRIQSQADLIDSRPAYSIVDSRTLRQGPPTIKDVPHVQDDQETFFDMKTQITAALTQQRLSWDDVEDVTPFPDWSAIFARRSRPQSWNLRWSYHAAKADSAHLHASMRKVLEYHPTLRSMAVDTGAEVPLLLSMRANEQYLNIAITYGHEVETKDDLANLLLDDPVLDSATMGGPLFRVHVAAIRSDGTSGVVIIASHAICDMSMTKLWMDDIVTALSGEGAIAPHVAFQDYATAYNKHRHGHEASNGVKYWTEKLQGVGCLPETTYWPRQRAPEFFKGNDVGWSRQDGRKARKGERSVPLSDKLAAQKGIRRLVKVEDIARLKSEYDVPVFMLVKAAIAMMNTKQTAGKEAIFGTLNAARTWPFASDYSPAEREAYRGNPLDISGCTCEYVLDRVAVPPHAGLAAFMQQVARGEERNSAYADAPVLRIVDALRDPLSADDARTWAERERDAEAVVPLVRRQSFNWLPTAPTAQGSDAGLRMLQMLTRMDNGLTVTGFLADDKRSVALAFTWDAEHLTLREANAALDDLARFVENMGRSANWERSVMDVMNM